MNSDQLLQFLYNGSLICTLWATGIAVGLSSSVREMIRSVTQLRLMAQGLFLNLFVLPVLVWGLTRIVPMEPGIAVGLVLLIASAGGPYGLVATQLAGGDAVLALALIAILQVTRVFTIPLWVGLALPFGLNDALQVLLVLALYILLPVAIGLALQRLFPRPNPGAVRVARGAAMVFLAILLVSAILLYREVLAALLISWATALFLLIQLASLGLGYLFGRPSESGKKTIALTAVVRSSATALLIATQVYGGQPLVVATVILYGVIALVVATLAAAFMARRQPVLAHAGGS